MTDNAPRDCSGLEIKEGDIVTFQPSGVVRWRVVKIQDGGLLLGPGQRTPSMIRIQADVAVMVPPGAVMPGVAVLKAEEKKLDTPLM